MTAYQNNLKLIIDKRFIYIMGCLAAFLIFFQTRLAFGKFEINLNVADLLAICGFVAILLQNRKEHAIDLTIPYVKSFVMIATAAFSLALLIGTIKFSFAKQAFFSKFMGFFILLGYTAIGALFIKSTKANGFEVIARLMTTVLASILVFQITVNFLAQADIIKPSLYHYSLNGFAANRNAFAMQILYVLCLELAILSPVSNPMKEKRYWLLSFLLCGLVFTYSRSAIVSGAVLLLMATYIGMLNKRTLMVIILQVSTLNLIIIGFEKIYYYAYAILSNTPINAKSIVSLQYFSNQGSDSQRLYTLTEGMRLWLENPWFGIGLGGFGAHEVAKNNLFLVIHNSYLWLLTEFGMVGSFVFFWYGVVILKHIYNLFSKAKINLWNTQDKILVGLVTVFLPMSMAHEIIYQRLFWFVLGTAIVRYRSKQISEKGTV